MNIVFDIGNVLIRWNLLAGFDDLFADQAALDAWLDRVGFHDWNLAQDAGRPIAEGVAVARAAHGDAAAPLAEYLDRFGRTITQPIEGTWGLMARLRAAGHPIYAITNWGAETWPIALDLHPRLHDAFIDVVVSGIEKRIKPDPVIFQILLDRNGLAAGDCLFIDDSPRNVAGAQAVGMQAVLFTDPASLERDLVARGLL